MSLRLHIPEMPAEDLIELLADPHRSVYAYTRLLTLGAEATDAARRGLSNPEARVREHCCKVLDHLMDAGSIPALIEALADPAAPVRIQAVHALACDRCKTDACRPTPEAVLPPAIAMLASDPSAHVRAHAAELVGHRVPSHPAARAAINRAAGTGPVSSGQKEGILVRPGRPDLPLHRSRGSAPG